MDTIILVISKTESMKGIGERKIKIAIKNLKVITMTKKYMEAAKIKNVFKLTEKKLA
ncbi:hypothetical protein Celal_0274 [Cellulophaga algicola DSM 14237]|uniref:Uncharacterized protein n=1 Tax=Cellulophaga algicola (strain DSM 14237 / IC166 / ACAM 630) TaxID=688270 RepID=E6X8N3_CELAD|nr:MULTISPECIES: hypothetical protein [Cellulophaga]ADV47620.1 hypothetical protein Celal_0274 [Cellulophaga algicola DSM 14237]